MKGVGGGVWFYEHQGQKVIVDLNGADVYTPVSPRTRLDLDRPKALPSNGNQVVTRIFQRRRSLHTEK
jgi:hypothetical protein